MPEHKSLPNNLKTKESRCDILIVGGGTGGVAAALSASSMGLKVILTEEFEWVGGQLTSQLVPPDEHPWIEKFGCTARYREFRNRVRQYYQRNFPLTPSARNKPNLNPGGGWVSRICFEPSIGWQVLLEMLQPAMSLGKLEIRQKSVPIAANIDRDSIQSVTIRNLESGENETIHATYFLDATETGDLLPLAKVEYSLGAESKSETGEEHALEGASDPMMVQGLTWCSILANDEGSHRTIDRPQNYEKWKSCKPANWTGKLFSFTIEHPVTGEQRELPLFPKEKDQWYTLFSYRQILSPEIFDGGSAIHPATVVNWPMNDYYLKPILDVPEEERQIALAESRDLTHNLLYWLQTDAPRHDGGVGYPGLYFRPDMTGTVDGLAQAPYIRESRRIKSLFTVTESMVSGAQSDGIAKVQADPMPKSVGIGAYRMDLHPRTHEGPPLDVASMPYQIPLGSLVPVRIMNLLAAGKNLGVTHIANGSYRLHPTEWNVGESAGLLASFCIENKCTPHAIVESDARFREYCNLLHSQGIETSWPTLKAL